MSQWRLRKQSSHKKVVTNLICICSMPSVISQAINKTSVLAHLTLSITSNDFTNINHHHNPNYHSEVVQAAKETSSNVLISNKLTVELTCKDIICSFLAAYEIKYNPKPLHEIIQTWMSKHKEDGKQNRWIDFAKFYKNTIKGGPVYSIQGIQRNQGQDCCARIHFLMRKTFCRNCPPYKNI